MSKWRKAAKVDTNQIEIVATLRKMGFTVAPGHDDILVGDSKNTYWFELKDMDTWKKNGGLKAHALKDSQVALLQNWKGHYAVVWTLEQILNDMGVK